MRACPFCQYAGPSPILREYRGRKYGRPSGVETIVIEPLSPVTEGHVLVIPKPHVRSALDSPKIAAVAMFDAAWYAGDVIEGPCNIITSTGLEATQTVMHLHVHVVPRRDGDGLRLPWSRNGGSTR